MDKYNELLTLNYWEIIKQIADRNNISLKKAVEKYHDISGLPSQEVYEKVIKYMVDNDKSKSDAIYENIIDNYKKRYEIKFDSPYVHSANNIYYKYLLNIFNLSEESIKIDGKILSEFIFLKYGGENMADVLSEILKELHKKNHFLPTNISIN